MIVNRIYEVTVVLMNIGLVACSMSVIRRGVLALFFFFFFFNDTATTEIYTE